MICKWNCPKCGKEYKRDSNEVYLDQTAEYCGECAPKPPSWDDENIHTVIKKMQTKREKFNIKELERLRKKYEKATMQSAQAFFDSGIKIVYDDKLKPEEMILVVGIKLWRYLQGENK